MAETYSRRIGISLAVELMAVVVMWAVSISIGIYSAVNQSSAGYYVATILGFPGLAMPNFLFALALMYVCYNWFGVPITGLFSAEYMTACWSVACFLDLASYVWAPIRRGSTGPDWPEMPPGRCVDALSGGNIP